ncbi:reverse transcriptase [Gossypium australe]|uniref:Reverse transcriptase n=1 Tax=Gossypium australe TaxID=47621 RepID=A0A5B6UX61_9ROSI|nr:reverse transcriptase [Gossypium australe]
MKALDHQNEQRKEERTSLAAENHRDLYMRPKIDAPQLELKPFMCQLLQNMGQFSGMPIEDIHLHLRLFMEVNDSFKMTGSLRDRARAWLNSLPSCSVTTWQELVEHFLMKYFPLSLTVKLQNEITSFQQLDKESLYET